MSRSAVWYPTVFPNRCDGCESLERPRCIAFCPKGVFDIRNERAVVINPQDCVYGCIACQSVCPKRAITFPQRDYGTEKPIRDKGLLHRVKCRNCGKVFTTNRDTYLCLECEKRLGGYAFPK
ncbi:MAG: 4Fe-4S dicluster domain-containing protein [Candidatus Bathyarchaeia archaeon]